MKPKKRMRAAMRALCAEFREDDGVDPRDDRRAYGSAAAAHGRKALQLCRQIAETLDLVLSGECRDETLQDLQVASVVPAPNASRLLVTLVADLADEEHRQAILGLLQRQAGRLRSEVAAAIHRRRTPVLTFGVVARRRPAT